MDYEQKYKDALEMAREAFYSPETPHVAKAWLLTMFPTIVESENKDERIKREILELVSIAGNGNQFEEIKDWLDKQGEGDHPHWISVEDELPPNNGGFSDEVWTYNLATNQRVVAQFNYISNCWFGCDDTVTHWMPLPEPPAKLSNLERTGKNEL